MQPFRLVDELGRYLATAQLDWAQADKENARLREQGNGRRWVPDLDHLPDFSDMPSLEERAKEQYKGWLGR